MKRYISRSLYSLALTIRQGSKKTFVISKVGIGLVTLFAISCTSAREQYWHDRLYAVDHAIISDSAIWAISKDTDIVVQIEKSDSASRAINAVRRKYAIDDSIDYVLRPYWRPLDSFYAILEDEEAQARDFADYPDPMPDSFVIWARDNTLVTPEQFIEILDRDMAIFDSMHYEYRKRWVTCRRQTMTDPTALPMPRGMDYIGAREDRNSRMLVKLTTAIVLRKRHSMRSINEDASGK
jgi:hypothetical protein